MSAISLCCHGSAKAIDVTSDLVADAENAGKVASLAISIFDFIEKMAVALSDVSALVVYSLARIADVVNVVVLVKRLKEIALPDEKGRMIWQRCWQSIAATITLVAYNVLNFINALGAMGIIAVRGVIGFSASIVLMVYSVFDICYKARGIYKANKKLPTVEKRLLELEGIKNSCSGAHVTDPEMILELWHAYAQKKILKWQTKLDQSVEGNPKAELKIKRWTALRDLDDLNSVRTYIDDKKEKWTTVKQNQDSLKIRSWVWIAFDIIVIVGIVLAFVLPMPVMASVILLGTVGLLANVIDITGSIIDACFPKKEVLRLMLPPKILATDITLGQDFNS